MTEQRRSLDTYFPQFSDSTCELLQRYEHVLRRTNEEVNLVSRKQHEFIWTQHILHSLAIVNVVDFAAGQHVADVGTGGGLPGIPLAIVFPEVSFTLIDSIGKKTRAVRAMAEELQLNNVSVINDRIENLNQRFDFITSRAVTALPKMMTLIHGRIRKGSKASLGNGLIYLKGGDFDDELLDIEHNFRVWSIQDMFDDPFFETKKVLWIDAAS